MSNEIFYTDDTKLKDLTVGQLKDIIIEVLSRGMFTRFEPERRTYQYEPGYAIPIHRPNPDYVNPYIPQGPTCDTNKGETC